MPEWAAEASPTAVGSAHVAAASEARAHVAHHAHGSARHHLGVGLVQTVNRWNAAQLRLVWFLLRTRRGGLCRFA